MAMPAPSELFAGTPRIWAVGGGKGGVGKSVITSSLAAAMAGMGRRVAVIDADLGAANHVNMLVVSGGRQRSEQEFRALYDAAGLTLTKVIPTLSPVVSLIEGVAR